MPDTPTATRFRAAVIRSAVALASALIGLAPLSAQETPTGNLLTRNPLDELKAELVQVLAEAGEPFTPAQEQSITLVLEESRRASEQLFGDVMDFSGGPPQGADLDRARAGIDWMNEDFSQRVRQYLRPAQLEVWDEHVTERLRESIQTTSAAGTSQQVQQIRVDNNPFTPEEQFGGQRSGGGSYAFSQGGGVRAEVIQRGGMGAWHGNYQFRFRDEALNARNPFASNKPPYQQRNITLNTSGPVIPERLTLTLGFNQNQQDNAETVNAITPTGTVELGFTVPQTSRNGYVSGILQLAGAQSLQFNVNVNRFGRDNEAVGGFTLPERAIDFSGGNNNVTVRHLWFGSSRFVQDISFRTNQQQQDAVPHTAGVSISVLGAFNGGGGTTRRSRRSGREELSALWIFTEDAYTIRMGGVLFRPRTNETSLSGFQGTYIFSDLPSLLEGRPILYTVRQGDPTLQRTQTEWSVFLQHEWRASDRFTLFLGARYEQQTNLDDRNNFAPRVSLAYALGNGMVFRAGAGLFHARIDSNVEDNLARLDGTRQSEIVITNPSYPEPFRSGDATVLPPRSRRVRAADLVAPTYLNGSLQVERSFPANLFVTASFDFRRGNHLLRSRNLNAPAPGDTGRPHPEDGNVWLLESTGLSTWKAFRMTLRQRFTLFTVSADYTHQLDSSDTTGDFSAPTNNFDLRADWATETEREFQLGVNSRLPFDLYLSADMSIRSGNQYTLTTGLDDNGDGETNDRPPGVPRYTERGPHRTNVRFNLSKAFVVRRPAGGGAPWNVNVFANVDNAFNRTNYSTPIGIITSEKLGQSIGAFNPREIEIGARFQF